MQKAIIWLMFLQCAFCSSLNAQVEFKWAKSGGGGFNDEGKAICTDGNGNIFVAVKASQNATFGSVALNNGANSLVLIKYSDAGDVLWAKEIIPQSNSGINSEKVGVCVDLIGNCYLTTTFKGTLYMSSDTFSSYGSDDICILKFDGQGDFIHGLNAGGSGYDFATDITADSESNIYITGAIGDSVYFDDKSMYVSDKGSFFVAKYDVSGNFLWVKRGGGYKGAGFGSSIKVDSKQNLYISGVFQDFFILDTVHYTNSAGGRFPCIVKYDSAGNLKWANGISTVGEATSVSIFPENGCIITGFFKEAADFNPKKLFSNGDQDIFIARYNTFGNLLWASSVGGKDADKALGISCAVNGNCVIGGYLGEYVDSLNYTYQNIFLAEYDSSGEKKWESIIPFDFDDPILFKEYARAIASKGTDFYVTGSFKGTRILNPFSLKTNGNADLFVAGISSAGTNIFGKDRAIDFQAYPNPVKAQVSLIFEDIKQRVIEVYSIRGQLLQTSFNENSRYSTLDLRNLAAGIYILRVRDDLQTCEMKLIKE